MDSMKWEVGQGSPPPVPLVREVAHRSIHVGLQKHLPVND